jgi:hypothetical protein
MLLRVSKKAGMWGFGPLWFTFADPKPQHIDLTELDETTRDKVNLAIAQGALIRVDESGEPVSIQGKQTQVVQRPVVDEVAVTTPQVSPVIARKLTELLKNGVTTLRREIPLIKSHQMLSAALQFEKDNKNRKTVIALFEKVIEKTGSIRMYDDLIKDEDVETVTFKVENMVLESKDEIVEVDEVSKENIKEKVEEL